MSDQPKFCKDCKWFSPGLNYPVCLHEKALVIDLVTGDTRQMNCEAMRMNRCDEEGKLWEKSDANP